MHLEVAEVHSALQEVAEVRLEEAHSAADVVLQEVAEGVRSAVAEVVVAHLAAEVEDTEKFLRLATTYSYRRTRSWEGYPGQWDGLISTKWTRWTKIRRLCVSAPCIEALSAYERGVESLPTAHNSL